MLRIFLITILSLLLCVSPVSAQTAAPNPPAAGPVMSTEPAAPNSDAVGQGSSRPDVVPTPRSLGVLSAGIESPAQPASFISQTLKIARCVQPPKIDGDLNDPCWRTATHIAGFYPYGTVTPIPANQQTEAWICVDQTHLYIAFHCIAPDPSKIVASQTVRNGDFTGDDWVGLDIDSQNSHRNFSSFLANARGTQESYLEGGTADNITWAGDWKAAGRRVRDGYVVEMSIPFGLMRYPRGTTSFGVLIYRDIHGQNGLDAWPYVPVQDATNDVEGLYLGNFAGLSLPYYKPRPTFLPYTLASAGSGNSVRNGIDIKYPLSTTLTGVASLYPDFKTIEQNITSINFSYTQKYLTDNRPFFAEGASFLPDNDLFYSRAIGQVDEGLKLVGKDNNTTIGLLGTNTSGGNSQSDIALNLRQDIGKLDDAGIEFVGDNQDGLESNRVGRIFGGLGWKTSGDTYRLLGYHTQSFEGGSQTDGADSLTFQNVQGTVNRPYFQVNYTDIGPNFISDLGYVPEVDKRGSSLVLGEQRVYGPKSLFNASDIELDADQYQQHTGGFFHDDASMTFYAQTASGLSFVFVPAVDQRYQFHDHTLTEQFNWAKNTLYQRGSLSDTAGQVDGQNYNYVTLGQGFLIQRPFNFQLNLAQTTLGPTVTTQTIITGTYRLDAVRAIGSRVVQQGGQTNIYFSFAQQVTSGTDLFILFGDPNSPTTKGEVTVKVVRPF